MSVVTLKKNLFGRWIITSADGLQAWSGSRWVAVDSQGMPLGFVQVSNLDSEEEAREYAQLYEFEVVA